MRSSEGAFSPALTLALLRCVPVLIPEDTLTASRSRIRLSFAGNKHNAKVSAGFVL